MQAQANQKDAIVDVTTSSGTNRDSDPVWLTPREAATFLGMSLSWMNQARLKGRTGVPPYRKIGGNVRYLRDDLLQYIETQKVTPESR
jgi:predicted DNA-binding transcriptional regulator AlpA